MESGRSLDWQTSSTPTPQLPTELASLEPPVQDSTQVLASGAFKPFGVTGVSSMPQALKRRLLASLELFPATDQDPSRRSCCPGLPLVGSAVCCTFVGACFPCATRPYAAFCTHIADERVNTMCPTRSPAPRSGISPVPLRQQESYSLRRCLAERGLLCPAGHMSLPSPSPSVPQASVRKQDPRRKQAPVPEVPDRPPLPCPSPWAPWA